MDFDKAENIDGANTLLEFGAELTGSAIGGVVGFLLAGPIGAAAGGASGPLVTRTIIYMANDIQERFLSKREKVRIGAVIYYATIKIQEKLAAGETLRRDDFFQKPLQGRAAAEEIIEGVLLSAQREHEEKKLNYFGNLLANIAFESQIDKSQANLLIKLGKNISFRQMCLLNIFQNSERFALRDEDYLGLKLTDPKIISLLQEIFDIYMQGLLNCSGHALLGLSAINPNKMRLQGMGSMLYALMKLWQIDETEMDSIVLLLQ